MKKYSNTEQLLKTRICRHLSRIPRCVVYMIIRQSPRPGQFYRSPYMPKGIPDLLVCWEGRFIGIEVKRPDSPKDLFGKVKERQGKLSDEQKHEIARIEGAGGKTLIAHSLQEVSDFLKSLETNRAPHSIDFSGADLAEVSPEAKEA